MDELLGYSLLGNSIKAWLIAAAIIFTLLLLIRIFRIIVLKRLKSWSAKTNTTLDDFVIRMTEKAILPILNAGAVYAGLQYLVLSVTAQKVLHIVLAVVIAFFTISLITASMQHVLEAHLEKQERALEKKRQLRGIMIFVKILIWSVGLIFLLDNLGYNVTAVVTGLGIGGIAIALAVQKILGDLFSYFVIFFDRPFEIGDFIAVDNVSGTIEYIGLKTTRLRSLSGEEMVVSNTDLTNLRIHNFKKMHRRRIVFKLNVGYATSIGQLKNIPGIIEEIFKKYPDATLDRAHFQSFGDFSLNFEIVYFVETPDFNRYMDIQQEINLEINKAFVEHNIEFAFNINYSGNAKPPPAGSIDPKNTLQV